MTIKIFGGICLFLTVLQASGQGYIDSLETRILLVDNDQKLQILDQIIPHYFRNEPLKAKQRAERMLSISRQSGDKLAEIKARRYLSIADAFLTSDYEDALEACYTIEENAKANGFTEEIVQVKLAIADIFRQTGDYAASLKNQAEAWHLADSMGYIHLKVLILNGEAQNYLDLGDNEKAELALKRSVRIAQQEGDLEKEAEANILFGDLFTSGFNHQMALAAYKNAKNLYDSVGLELYTAIALFKIGNSYFSMDEMDSSFQYHLRALQIRNKRGDITGQAESYNKIGLICIENGEFPRAIRNLRIGLGFAEKANSKILIQQSFSYLTQAYLGNGQYEKALEFQRKNAEITELIYAESSERKVQEFLSRHELEQQNKTMDNLRILNQQTQKALASSRNFSITLALLFLVLLTSALWLVALYRAKRRANKELKITNDRISRQNLKLQEVNSTKDKFFSIIGHDLKGPLNSLSAFAHLLMNHTASLTEEEIRTIARDLDMSLKNLYELLDNLLGWARSQTGRIEMKPETISVIDIVKENTRLLSKAAQNKGIKIEVDIDSGLRAYADVNTVRTVLRNLISNSIKFTPSGGIITVFADSLKDRIEIGVHDTGVGMSKEVQKKVFDISSKYTTLGTDKEKGTGLGLILCKEFIEKNQGNIAVESEVGNGTTIRFNLPKGVPEALNVES